MRMAAGGPHPVPPAARQRANPRPYFPPIPKAAFLRPGTRTTQFAFSRSTCGIDRSGVLMISEKRLAESSNRSAVFVFAPPRQDHSPPSCTKLEPFDGFPLHFHA